MKKLRSFLYKVILSVGILGILSFAAVFILLKYHEKWLTKEVNNLIHKEISPDIEVGRVKVSIWGILSGTHFEVQNTLWADSLYVQHSLPLLKIPAAKISICLPDLLHKKLTIEKVHLQNTDFNIFCLKNDYSNKYLLSKKDSAPPVLEPEAKKKGIGVEIGAISIENSRVHIFDRPNNKDFHFQIDNVSLSQLELGLGIKAKINAEMICKKMVFDTKQGSFLENAAIQFETHIELDSQQVFTIKKSDYLINNEYYTAEMRFGLGPLDTLDVRILKPDAKLPIVRKLLSASIQTALNKIEIQNPIDAKAHLFGRLSGNTPNILVEYKLLRNLAKTPYLELEKLSLNGYFKNNVNPLLPTSDENSIIVFKNLKGVGKDIHFQTQLLTIQNLISPIISSNLTLDGNVQALKPYTKGYPFELRKGKFKLYGNFSSGADISLNNLLNIDGGFEFQDVEAAIPQFGYLVKKFNCRSRYSQKKFLVDILKFDVQYVQNPKAALKFLSEKSEVNFAKKVKLLTQMALEAHPEFFGQFLEKKGIVPSGGRLTFRGVFHDYIDFSWKTPPNVSGDLSIENMDLALSAYPIVFKHSKGLLTLIKNTATTQKFTAQIFHQKALNEMQKVDFLLENATLKLGEKLFLEGDYELSAPIHTINLFLDQKDYQLEKGNAKIKGKFSGNVGGLMENIRNTEATVSLSQVDIKLPKLPLLLTKTSGDIRIKNSQLAINHLITYYKKNLIKLECYSPNIISYLFENKPNLDADIQVQSENFRLEELGKNTMVWSKNVNTNKKMAQKSDFVENEPILAKIYNTPNINIQFFGNFKNFSYRNLIIENLKLKASKQANILKIDQCNLRTDKGDLELAASIEAAKNSSPAQFFISSNAINSQKLIEILQTIEPKIQFPLNFFGDISFQSQFKFSLKPSLYPEAGSINGNYYFATTSLKLANLDQLLGRKPKFIFKRFLGCVCLSPFAIQSKINADTLLIPPTKLQTQYGELFLDGKWLIGQKPHIKFRIPRYNLSNMIFGTNISKVNSANSRHLIEIGL